MCQAVWRQHMTVSIHQRKNLYYLLTSGKQTQWKYHWLKPPWYVSLSFIVESRIEPHIWRHMYGFQLLVSDYVSVPEAFSVFSLPVQKCTVSLFLTFVCVCVWMCVSGCINYWLRVYSCLPQGLQPTNVAIPLSSLFVFQRFFVSETFPQVTSEVKVLSNNWCITSWT